VHRQRLPVVIAAAVALSLAPFAGAGQEQEAAPECDPAYVSHCVPPIWVTGDLNCDYFYPQGISGIILADPYNDPHGLDGWNYVDDGIGCEGEWQG
jgi:hypothetical protein